MELPDRRQIEADFAGQVRRLLEKHRKELEQLGYPPDLTKLRRDFWNENEDDMRELLLLLLLGISLKSAALHVGPRGYGFASTADIVNQVKASRLQVFAETAAQETAAKFAQRSRERLFFVSSRWQQTTGAEQPPLIATPDEIAADLETIFGDARAEMLAVTETTRAQQAGAEAAIAATVGLSQDDIWITRPYLSKSGPCPICLPLNNTPRSYWGRFFPVGPPSPHPGCVCYVEFANQSDEVVA